MSESGRDRDEQEALAAEYALGVLDGAERRAAETRLAHDPSFAAAVERWRAELAPLAELAASGEPPPAVWHRVEAALSPAPPASRPTPAGLWSNLVFWRGLSFAASATAAVLATALLLRPSPVAAPVPPAAAMATAPLMMNGGPALVAAAYDPAHRRVIVTPTAHHDLPPTQAMELWIIVGDKAPRSLGVVNPSRSQAHILPPDVRADLAAGAALAVSVEPAGGSPTGSPTGPVVAQGKFTEI